MAGVEKQAKFKAATMECTGEVLRICTGKVTRIWQWTGKGWLTSGLEHLESGTVWKLKGALSGADWSIPGFTGGTELLSVTAEKSDDEGFTSKHLQVVSTIRYDGLLLQHVVWAYPDAPGLRTQLRLKRTGKAADGEGVAESLPADLSDVRLRAIGYYSDTQNRNRRNTGILKEQAYSGRPAANRWASVLEGRSGDAGFVIVKESHKCVTTRNGGANTGGFAWNRNGICSSGLGWLMEDVGKTRYHDCWANWIVLYHGDEDEMALTMKVWDRIRYPIDPKRDMYIMANTWGSTKGKGNAQGAAREDNVLVEIESQTDLGIDVQQIDDGWQGHGYDNWRPVKSMDLPDDVEFYDDYKSDVYPVYPRGWKTVREYAEAKGVTLGLWAAWKIPTADLKWNFDQGGFRYYKIDFANLDTMEKVESLMAKARALILHSGHTARINWDVTERPPRVGYFFGREYGNIYLANRKPLHPANVVYKPCLVLRDAWELAKYVNLNKFQITVQNVERVSYRASNAYRHPHDYCVAQTLMGSPIFFQETRYYTEEARRQIRPLIRVYRKCRAEMFEGYVFPIGDRPDNRCWSGFQCHIPGKEAGYLTIFRQIENTDSSKSIALKFMKPGSKLMLTDLMNAKEWEGKVDFRGGVGFNISKAPGFLFLRYELRR